MKKLMTIFALTLTTLSFANTEVIFDKDVMNQCRGEVNKLSCGDAETTDDEELMNCVEQKKSKLSSKCLEVHNSMTKMRKTHNH